MKGKIKIKDPYKHYDDCEIEDFLKEKIPELIGKKIKRQQIDPSTFGRSFESDIDRKRKVPNYIITYRKQLNQHDTMISRMRRCISEHKKITFSDLKQYLNEEYGYQTENNGSIAASLHTLKIEKIVTVQGQGEGKIIRISE